MLLTLPQAYQPGRLAPRTGHTSGACAGSGSGMGVAPLVAIAIPAAISAVTSAIGLIMNRQNGAQKVAATQIVKEIERQLIANRDGYLAQPVRTRSMQAAALANYDNGWQLVVQNCSNPQLAQAGQRCIEDRLPGSRWPWQSYYRDPIADDPDVVDDPTITDSIVDGFSVFDSVATAATGGGPNMLFLAAAVLVGLALFMGGSSK